MKNKLILRAIEPTDLDKLYAWENDPRVWFHSSTTRPLSKHTLQLYIDSIGDIHTDKQVRLIFELNGESLGCVDLFEYDPLHQRAGIGIMIDQKHEGNGYAKAALALLKEYAFDQLGLHQLFCSISSDNPRSLGLFESVGFEITGTKKDWIRKNKLWMDEITLQCFNGN